MTDVFVKSRKATVKTAAQGRCAMSAVLLAVVLLSGCATAKKAPGWPSGEERPINANIPAQAGAINR